MQAESIKTKTVNTCLERYGETCAFKNSEIRAKARKTLEKRYGADWKKAVGQKILDTWRKKTEEERAGIADKARRTKAEKYGNEKYVNIEKRQRTKDERRKSDPMYQQKINSKMKATIRRKMAEDPSYRENINRKIVGTRMLHKAEDPDFQKKINEKIKKTCLERYGVEKPSLTPNAVKSARINSGRRSYERYILGSEYDEPLFSFEEYLSRKDSRQKLKFKCRKCGREFEAHHDNGFHGRCPVCFPLKSVSHQEKELVGFVKSLCPDLIENDRTLI